MERYGSVIGLSEENRAEYERLHREVWPHVLETITKCNITYAHACWQAKCTTINRTADIHAVAREADRAATTVWCVVAVKV